MAGWLSYSPWLSELRAAVRGLFGSAAKELVPNFQGAREMFRRRFDEKKSWRDHLKYFASLLLFVCLLSYPSTVFGGFIDFEGGTDGAVIASTIPGLEFTTTGGYDWVYGDWTTGSYNGPYPSGDYYSNGDFFAWLGPVQDSGRIDFTLGTATYLTLWTSTYSGLYLEAFDASDTLLDSVFVANNVGTGTMTALTVTAPGMAYVMVHDFGNYWLIDDLSTDAEGVPGAPVPEPATLILFGTGLSGLALYRRRKQGN